MRLFNTQSRKKEKIVPGKKPLLLYTCGPTVYGPAHIGNLRTFVAEDLLKRTLGFLGIDVVHCMNITDVDDKTIKGANEKGESLEVFTERYTKNFVEDLKKLGCKMPDHLPKATDYIPQMIALIEKLVQTGAAYVGDDGNVFFRLSSFPSYGKLSHLKMDELQVGASDRVASDEDDKDNVSDFVLWKAYDEKRDGSIYWDSPFGKGRPGWHIECSAMAMEVLGETIDIHCGGVDNIFPHHENEIAQSEAATGCCFSKHWVHVNHLIVDGKKMSKSLGNFYRLGDLLEKGYSGREVRYLLLSVHYQMQLNFTLQGLDSARQSLGRIDHFVKRLQQVDGGEPGDELKGLLENKDFQEALCDDLNISKALAALFDLIRDVNSLIDQGRLGKEGAERVLDLLTHWNRVLGFINLEKKASIPKEIEEAHAAREVARKEKNWAEADRLRDFIYEKGYVIEDGPKGSFLTLRSH